MSAVADGVAAAPQPATGPAYKWLATATVLCGMLASLAVFIHFIQEKGMQDVLSASAFATILFFASAGFVLYAISKPPLHELLPWDAPEQQGGSPQ